jgi:hypothetical protein
MVICLVTPIWGETEAGFEWDIELHETLLRIGWRQCPGVPAMYYFDGTDSDCRLVKIVDDLGFSESNAEQPITKATIAALQARYDGQVTSDLNPTSFTGYKVNIARSGGATTVELSQERKITEAARKYLPSMLEGNNPSGLLAGKALHDSLAALVLPTDRGSKLNAEQKRVQQIIGDLKYFERGSMPRISRMVHYLSCIMSFPPPGALAAAEGVLAYAYQHRTDRITYRRNGPKLRNEHDGRIEMNMTDGAPDELEVSADASNVIPAVIGILITLAGATVLHQTKKIGVAVGSTHDGENLATVKASEHAVYGRVVLSALGNAMTKATLCLTDNLSNQRVARNANSAVASRHFLIRSTCLHQRITDAELTVGHVVDPENPSDFLTKFIDDKKTTASIAYAAGSAHPTLANESACAGVEDTDTQLAGLDVACAEYSPGPPEGSPPPSPPPSPRGGDTFGNRRSSRTSWGRNDKASREGARRRKWDKLRRAFERRALGTPHPQECPVCLDNEKTCLLFPCGNEDMPYHRGHGLCEECAMRIIHDDYNCPLCNLTVHGSIYVGTEFFVA